MRDCATGQVIECRRFRPVFDRLRRHMIARQINGPDDLLQVGNASFAEAPKAGQTVIDLSAALGPSSG